MKHIEPRFSDWKPTGKTEPLVDFENPRVPRLLELILDIIRYQRDNMLNDIFFVLTGKFPLPADFSRFEIHILPGINPTDHLFFDGVFIGTFKIERDGPMVTLCFNPVNKSPLK